MPRWIPLPPPFDSGSFIVAQAVRGGHQSGTAVFSHVTVLRLVGVEVPRCFETDSTLHVSVRKGSVVPQRKDVTSHTRFYEWATIRGDGFFYFSGEVYARR